MAKRSYAQFCSVATALDVVGERWTLLVVRELLAGPRRFSDLEDGLPGIGTALLTQRLRDLQGAGLVERVALPRPARGSAYALTAAGLELEPVLAGLARFGGRRLGTLAEDDARTFRARWTAAGLRLWFDADAAAGVEQTFEFRVDDELFHARVSDGEVDVRDGPASHPDLVVATDARTFAQVAGDPGAAAPALRDGRLRLDGAPEAARALSRLFPASKERP